MKLMIFSSTHGNEYDVVYLEVETSVGNFVILDGHEPLVLLLEPNKPVIFTQSAARGAREKINLLHGGILKISRTQATLLINE